MSAQRPLVSILINNYNYGRFLRDAIDSALHQTYPNTEVVVVDDGSTDDSRQIIASYGSRIIPVLKENGGQGSAFNAGFALCRGEWVCLLDSDDAWHPAKIEEVVGATRKFPEAVLVYHKYQSVSEELKPVDRIRPAGVFCGWIDEIIERNGGWWACPPTSAYSFRKAVLERIGKIPEERFRICADAYLTYLVPFLGPVLGLNRCLVDYRLHGGNRFSNAALLRKSGNADLLHKHLRRYEELVESVNAALRRLGVPRTLDLKNHWNYQALKFKLQGADRLPFFHLVWRGLQFSGDPALSNRLRMIVRFSLDTLRYNQV